MAQKNEIYQPQARISGDMVAPTNRGERFEGFDTRGIVAGLNVAADFATQELDDRSRAWAANATSQADVAAQEMLERKKREAADGAPKFKESVLKDWKKYQDETLKNVPNGLTGELLQDHFNSVTKAITLKADEFEVAEDGRWKTKMADDGVDADAKLISTLPPTEVEGQIEKSLGKWTAHYKAMGMEPADRQKLIDATREKLTNAANMRLIQADPDAYKNANAMARDPQVLASDPKAPRGIRNNNPGNLRPTKDQWQGANGDDGGYLKFKTPEAGLRAMAKNLVTQQEKHGLNTVEDIITKYAPKEDDNNTMAYISQVSTAMGVGPGDRLNLKDPQVLQGMMVAMIKHENGVQPYAPEQIQYGVGAALGNESLPPVKTKATADGEVITQTQGLSDGTRSKTGSAAFNLGTWEQQQKWMNYAETESRRLEAERKQKVTEANVLMTSAKDRMQSGLMLPEDEMQAISAIVAGTGDAVAAKKWQDLQAVQQVTQSMQQLSPAQLSTVINTQLEPAARRDGATEREAMQLDIGQKLLGTMTTKVKEDPLSWAAQTGMAVAPLDFNKPESLPARVANARAIADKYGIPVERAIFSQAEKTQFADAIAQMPDNMKLQLGKRMQAGFGEYFTRAVSQLSEKDPIFSHATFLSGLSASNDGLALDILAGQRILKEVPDLKPSKADKQVVIANLGNAFEFMPQALPGVIAAADALYAKRVGNVDSFDQTAYEQAIEDVVGKTKEGTGGIADMNGGSYLLPQQFSEDDFERGIKSMTADELAEMSIGGGYAVYGSKQAKASGEELMRNLTIRSVAYGQYALFDGDGNRVTSDKGPKGQFILAVNPQKMAAIIARANEKAAQERASGRSGWGMDGGGIR